MNRWKTLVQLYPSAAQLESRGVFIERLPTDYNQQSWSKDDIEKEIDVLQQIYNDIEVSPFEVSKIFCWNFKQ